MNASFSSNKPHLELSQDNTKESLNEDCEKASPEPEQLDKSENWASNPPFTATGMLLQ